MNLREAPWDYPGQPLTEAIVLGIPDATPGEWVRLLARSERRLGQACVRMPEGDLPLNYVLLTHNAAAVDGRRPIAAFGSNADPAVLHSKFQDAAVNSIVPMRVGKLANARLATSAHVSGPGYLPAAAEHAPGMSLRVVVAWLDGPQLEALDSTEPNYNRVILDPEQHPIVLDDNSEELPGAALYDTRWGVLPGDPTVSQLAQWRALLGSQPAVADLLEVSENADVDAVKDLMRRLGKDPVLRAAVRDLLRPAARLGGLIGQTGGVPPAYGSGPSRWPRSEHVRDGTALEVRATRDDTKRHGEVVVTLHPTTAAAVIGSAGHATVSPVVVTTGGQDLRVLVSVHRDRDSPETQMRTDQVARNALGLELTETATLEPARVPRNRLADAVFGRPTYVTCRVQPADLTTVERQVCLTDPLTLSLLGIGSGDEVVVDGFPADGDTAVSTRRLRAHEAPDTVLDRRGTLSGGTFESRFPSSRDALGVYPDLPWIFLDSGTRTALHVRGKLGTVRIRASRRYQLLRELRESLLLALLALVGLAQVIKEPAVLIGLTLAVLGLSAAAVVMRLRNRLVGSG
jgi:hypothetical protein